MRFQSRFLDPTLRRNAILGENQLATWGFKESERSLLKIENPGSNPVITIFYHQPFIFRRTSVGKQKMNRPIRWKKNHSNNFLFVAALQLQSMIVRLATVGPVE